MRILAALLLSLVLAAPAPAGAAERRPGPESAYMVGLDIHTPSGRLVRVPLPRRNAVYAQLLGRTRYGWVVGAGKKFYVVDKGVATRIGAREGIDSDVSETLSLGGRYLLSSAADREDLVTTAVWDLKEMRRVDLGSFTAAGGTALAADRKYVYYGGRDYFRRASFADGEPMKYDKRSAVLADAGHDVVFFRSGTRVGWTNLSGPGSLPWKAGNFEPVAISPDGTSVLGRRYPVPDVVGDDGSYEVRPVVRRMSDGRVVATLPPVVDDDFVYRMGWDGNGAVLTVLRRDDRYALRRCVLASGRCQQVTRWSARYVSLPVGSAGRFLRW
jgi:hypothetical protein